MTNTTAGATTDKAAKESKDPGPSGADVAIATGTTVGAGATAVLAGVSAYPIAKDAWNAGKKVFGKAEDALEDVAGGAKDVAQDALEALGLSGNVVQTTVDDLLKLGKDATSSDIVAVITKAVEEEGPSVAETATEDAIKAAAKAIKVGLELI